MESKFSVTGMSCSACSARVERVVGRMEGMNQVTVNLLTNSMQVNYDADKITDEMIIQVVEKAGYGATLAEEKIPDAVSDVGNAGGAGVKGDVGNAGGAGMKGAMIKRLIVSFAFMIPLMVLAMGFMHHEEMLMIGFTQFLLLLPILLVNRVYYVKGFLNLVRLSPNMDTLIAVGSSAAVIYGVFALYRMMYGLNHGMEELVHHYGGNLYFESAGMILTLITLGKYLESRSKGKTSAAIEKLMSLSPDKVTVIRDGKEVEIPIEELKVGELFLVRPGERIPVDGVIVEGTTSVDESAITGESIPVEKTIGEEVISASMNQNGIITCKAAKVGKDTTIQKIIRLVEEASASKAPIARLADKISGIFVPVVMGIALLAAVVWLLTGATVEFALSTGIAVLVISCPCALGLATPVAIMVGTGRGAENGILFKSGEALEKAKHVRAVVLDKTGTITKGEPVVTDVLVNISEGATAIHSEEEFINVAYSIEKGSGHPLAGAITRYGEKKGATLLPMENKTAVFGKGMKATMGGGSADSLEHSVAIYYAGNAAYMEELGVDITGFSVKAEELAKQGKTPLFFAVNKELLGIIAVADVEKEESLAAIRELKKKGIRVIMLTGDNKVTAEAMRAKMDIDEVVAEVLPHEKAMHVNRLKQEGYCVAMVGDGINDAPALASADVSMAIGAGTDIAMESADIILMKNSLMDVVTALRLSGAVLRNIKQNLFWAFFYNSIGIPLAAGVFYNAFGIALSPMIGAAAMSLSSVCVVTNALRLRRFR